MKRILFVDDESRILDGIRRMLYADRKRWEMDFALGGEAALQACECGSFDVVVTDMRMPGMDGATLLTHMRDRYPGTARIILTGHCDLDAATRAIPVTHRLLAKPCDAPELQSAIERVCTLQEILSGAEVRRVVGSIGNLPSLSNTYTLLADAVRNPGTPMKTIAEIIERDMAMSAKVLQLVNSAFFGLAQTVTSLQSAVNHLGIDTIKNLVLVAETFSAFVPRRTIPDFSFELLQSHAQRAAHIVSKLPLDPKIREVTVMAALLHDIGKLILASKLPDKFCEILAHAREHGCEAYEAEEAILGISHAEIGAYLLGLWGIPHLAVEAIAHHHHPTRIPHSVFDSCLALYIGDLLANDSGASSDGSPGALRESDQRNLETLGLLDRLEEFRGACPTT